MFGPSVTVLSDVWKRGYKLWIAIEPWPIFPGVCSTDRLVFENDQKSQYFCGKAPANYHCKEIFIYFLFIFIFFYGMGTIQTCRRMCEIEGWCACSLSHDHHHFPLQGMWRLQAPPVPSPSPSPPTALPATTANTPSGCPLSHACRKVRRTLYFQLNFIDL